MNSADGKRKLTPLNITMVYAVIGVAWGVASCLIPAVLSDKSFMYQAVETLNHALFILATAGLLYLLIGRSHAEAVRGRESLSRVNRALKTLSGCNQALIRAGDEVQLMNDICRTIVEVGGYRLAWVGVAEHDPQKTVRPVAQWGDTGGYLDDLDVSWNDTDRGRGPTGTAIRTGKTCVVQNIRFDPSWSLWRDKGVKHGFAASISLPLVIENRPLGALVIFAGEKRAFGKQEVKLLESLAEDLSFGIDTLRMNAGRKKAEKELMLLASVIEQSMEGLMLFDSDGVIKYVNPAMETITGHEAQQIVGRDISTLDAGEPGGEFYRYIWDDLSRGEARNGHFVQRGGNGEFYELDTTRWSISDSSGTVITHAVLTRDVTHEVQLERQLRQAQRMEAIATLAGGIAHDFNNNLASIITCTEMARDDLPDQSPTRELLDVVLKSSYRGRKLVKQILTFCCQGEQERQPVQVEGIIMECLNLMRASLSPSIAVRTSLQQEPGLIMADPTQVHQIIMNLITNASHAMRHKGGALEVALEGVTLQGNQGTSTPDLPAGQYLKLSVKDSGHGMDQQTMERIFDPFFTTKGHTEGTGLGLSVVHGIVRNHGGGITVSSMPGAGATFEIYLPRLEREGQEQPLCGAQGELRGSGRILLVDDEADVVFGCGKMLERLGYQVTARKNGREALQAFEADPRAFDLVITDQTMPEMTGTELARALTQIRPELPVILCTGLGPTAEKALQREEVQAAGIREIALKPLDREELALTVRRVLKQDEEGIWQGS